MNCVVCHAELRSGAKFCPQCGTAQPVAPAETGPACPHCQTPLKPGAKFCGNCGESLAPAPQPEATALPPPAPEIAAAAAPLPEPATEAAPEAELTQDHEPITERAAEPELAQPASPSGQIRREPTFASESPQGFAEPEKARVETAAAAIAQPAKSIPILPVIGGVTLALVAMGAGAWIMLSGSSAPAQPPAAQSLPALAPVPAPVPASAPQVTPQLRLVSPGSKASAPARAPAATSPDEDEAVTEETPAIPAEKPKARHKAAEHTRDTESEEAYVRQMNKQLEEQIKDLRKQQNH